MDAKKQMDEAIQNIRALLGGIGIVVDKYAKLENPHHGQASDLHYLEHLLDEAYNFIRH